MSDNIDIDDLVQEHTRLPAISFPNVGDTVKGDIIATRVGNQRDFETGELVLDDTGQPKKQVRIDLRTADGDMRLFCKPACWFAIVEAVTASGGRLSAGGTLTVKRTEDGEPSKKGFNPPHQFKAKFEPKVAGNNLDDLDDF